MEAFFDWIAPVALCIWLANMAWSSATRHRHHRQLMNSEAIKIELLKRIAQGNNIPVSDVEKVIPPKSRSLKVREITTIVVLSLIALLLLIAVFNAFFYRLFHTPSHYL